MNTEQFNGHSPGPWAVGTTDYETQFVVFTMKVKSGLCGWPIALSEADTHLIAAAPALLAEVKRLREELRVTQSNFSMVRNALANQYPEIEEAIWKVIE
tara:strand:- start:192 stop:488 length:297 start_codon:yes stop_codon:yes gene_type:complete